MSRLKPRERAMLWLAYAEGASHREIADVLGLRPGSLKAYVVSRAAQAGGAVGRRNQMKPVECEFESEVLAAALQSRWPDAWTPPARARRSPARSAPMSRPSRAPLTKPARKCGQPVPGVPDSGRVWWLAQLRARREAAKAAGRPITAAQVIALACAVGLLGACFGATSLWFQSALRRIQSTLAGFSAPAFVAEHGFIVLAMAFVVLLIPGAVYLALGKE